MRAKHGIHPEWADEALADPDRVVLDPDPASKSGRSIRNVGWSHTAGTVLTVITVEHKSVLYGVNGWRSNVSDQRRYRQE